MARGGEENRVSRRQELRACVEGKGLVARTQLLSKPQQRGDVHTLVQLSSACLSTKQRSFPLLHISLYSFNQRGCGFQATDQGNALEGVLSQLLSDRKSVV